jgi:hypothetical protein
MIRFEPRGGDRPPSYSAKMRRGGLRLQSVFFLRSRSRPKSDSFDPKILNRAEGGNVGTIRRWICASFFLAITACFYWVGHSVYSIKYALSADKIYLDPKPPDCDFWYPPVGNKGCHYQNVVIARDAKEVREIRRGQGDPNRRFDSVLISWVKKSD